jgi:hypothetical protein
LIESLVQSKERVLAGHLLSGGHVLSLFFHLRHNSRRYNQDTEKAEDKNCRDKGESAFLSRALRRAKGRANSGDHGKRDIMGRLFGSLTRLRKPWQLLKNPASIYPIINRKWFIIFAPRVDINANQLRTRIFGRLLPHKNRAGCELLKGPHHPNEQSAREPQAPNQHRDLVPPDRYGQATSSGGGLGTLLVPFQDGA